MDPIGQPVGEELDTESDVPLEAGRIAEPKLEAIYPVRSIDPHAAT